MDNLTAQGAATAHEREGHRRGPGRRGCEEDEHEQQYGGMSREWAEEEEEGGEEEEEDAHAPCEADRGPKGVFLAPFSTRYSHTHARNTMIDTVKDPGSDDPEAHNAEFHFVELPPETPPHLLKYLPNLTYSDALENRRFAVLVTAKR